MLSVSCGALARARDIVIGTSQKGASTEGKGKTKRTRSPRWTGTGHAGPMEDNG